MDVPAFKLRTLDDVNAFLRFAVFDAGLGWDFHPDDDFSAFVVRAVDGQLTDESLFSPEDAERLNNTIDECFEICKKLHKDIYYLTLQLQLTIPEERMNE